MKVFLFFLFTIWQLGLFSQDTESNKLKIHEDGSYYFQRIVETGLTSDENYKYAKNFLVYGFKNADYVIRLDEKQQIIVKSHFKIPYQSLTWGTIHNTLTIDIKDEKIRLTFDQIEVQGGDKGQTNKMHDKTNFWYPKRFKQEMIEGSEIWMLAFSIALEKHIMDKDLQDDW
ncbi:MAG: hypothetical protein IPL63_06495 [Saprospiraceae bacterium]|nr:hypothetical protein [Saprospiraceae bacterium]MBK6564605.1 hypothetical protein [Saprospiraceae bacterium]MBK7523246.1 hypothetical protein [Saprospiraceae bacterium]MBK8079339.1 hypothetical protein [Saprospiraceae bacterium]MBK8371764.1 hypothetical protein [Saprospiraceae bacterium]